MNLDILIAHPYLAAGIVALFANLFVCGVLYGCSGAADRHRRALVAWWAKTFTAAGDGCAVCNDWHQPVYCLACHHVRMLRPAETVTRAERQVLLADLEEAHRRREAFAAFDDMDFDLDEQAVN